MFVFFLFRIGLYTTRVHKEAGRAVDDQLADAVREAVPEPAGAASGLGQAGDGVHGPGGGGQSGPGAGQERAVHCGAAARRQGRAHQPRKSAALLLVSRDV